VVLALLVAACERAPKPPVRGAAVGAAHAVAPAPDSRRVILFIGTSLTAGLGLDPDQAYPAVVARRLDSLGENYEVVNAGVSGETSADARRRMGWLLRRPAAVIVLETGANDGLRGLGASALRENLQAIIDTVKAVEPGARIILAGMEAPPNMGPQYTAQFRATFPGLAKENGLALIPFLLAGVGGVDTLNQADGIHPNVRGAELVASNVMRVLLPVLASLPKDAAPAAP